MMCFFIFSPDGDIEVRYVLETIYLTGSGSSEIIADVLLENKSNADIVTLLIIYPNIFCRIGEPLESQIIDLSKEDCSEFDIKDTYQLLKPNHPKNNIYRIDGRRLIKEGDDTKTTDINLNKPSIAKVIEPNPLNPVEDLIHEGYVSADYTMDIFKPPQETNYLLLMYQRIGYSVFEINLSNPIRGYNILYHLFPFLYTFKSKNYNRCWLRLRFKPSKTARVHTSALFSESFSFEIVGPDIVKERFKERLICYEQELISRLEGFISANDLKNKQIPVALLQQLQSVKKISEYVLYQMIDELIGLVKNLKTVKFRDWRVIFKPPDDMEIMSFNMFGNVRPIGDIPDKVNGERYYKFRSGSMYKLTPLDFHIWLTGVRWMNAKECYPFSFSGIVRDEKQQKTF